MPRKGYKQITVCIDLLESLKSKAKEEEMSIPRLLEIYLKHHAYVMLMEKRIK